MSVRLILGSSSPRRRELLTLMGLVFESARPDIDETPFPDEPAAAYVERMCREKAAAIILESNDPALILTADTTVVHNGQIVGKPADPDEARAMLSSLRGRAHTVLSGLALRNTQQGIIQVRVIETSVYLRSYSDAEINAYVDSGEPFDKAGGYAVQDARFHPVERLQGCATNVMGLPVCAVWAMLRAAGLKLGDQSPIPLGCDPEHTLQGVSSCRWPV